MNNKLMTANQYIVKVLTICFFVFGFSLIAQSFTAPQASAALECTGPVPCLSTSIDLAVHGASSNSNWGPGSGGLKPPSSSAGSSAPPPIPKKCFQHLVAMKDVQYCGPAYKVTTTWLPYTEAFKDRVRQGAGTSCPAKNINGFTIVAEGRIQTDLQRLTYVDEFNRKFWGAVETTIVCVYPPGPSQSETNIRCIIGYNAYFDRNANSYLGFAARVKTVGNTVSSASDIIANPASCKRSVTASLNYNPPTNRNAWGQYTATSTIQAITCSFATTSFNGASTSLAKCGGAYNVAGTTSRLTIWCGGYAPGHLNKSWSADDCYNTGRYNCTIPNNATYNGRTGLVQGMRDGQNSLLQWGTPTPTGGVRAVKNWESLTTINSNSTPYAHSFGENDRSKQLFYSDNVKFGSWQNGSNLSQNLAFYTAGNSGAPFSMTRLYRYDAEFLTSSAIIGSYDIVTGAITTTPTSVWVPDTDVSCGPQGSPRIEVIRAIGDSVR
jgi:hypothetical protein